MKFSAPKHVVCRRQRSDGTYNVVFRVREDRPDGWPSSIPIPRNSPRRGNLNDPVELAAIIEEAAALTSSLEAQRKGGAATHRPGTMPAVAASWELSWDGAGLRARTQDFYRKSLRPLLAWSATNGDPLLAEMTVPLILQFLKIYFDRPAQQRALKATLSALLSFARDEGVIAVHPLGAPVRAKRNRSLRKRAVKVWTAADVKAYADRADVEGWRGLGNMLWLMWETSADATDVVTWRRRTHYHDNAAEPSIEYVRGKTGEKGSCPISHTLAKRLQHSEIFLVWGPGGTPYEGESVKADNRRSTHFRALRRLVVDDGGRFLLLDHLRHSAVTDALTKGALKEHLPSLTAHRGGQMVDAVYSQMTRDQARAVQKARGIIS